MLDVLYDTLIDAVKILPFLFLAFLLIEFLEHKMSNKYKNIISSSGKVGPLVGGILGIFPQCGFSVMATNLYVTRIITLGTLISVYLSTSDEMLPILLSENAPVEVILQILAVKLVIGIIAGFIIDLIFRKKEAKEDFHICTDEHCDCEHGILKSSIKHTLKTLIFIMIISFILNIIFEFVGSDFLSKLLLKNSIFSPFITSLIGLIPNCGASVIITELYLAGSISFAAVIAGLLTGSGIALLVLFKENKNFKENILILFLVYGIGVFSGIILELIGAFYV